jgi:hypothetical protein
MFTLKAYKNHHQPITLLANTFFDPLARFNVVLPALYLKIFLYISKYIFNLASDLFKPHPHPLFLTLLP